MTLESAKEALQAALADLLLATASELEERKHPGWACCVCTKDTQPSSSTLHSLVDDGGVSQGDFNQLLVDAGLLKKPKQSSHAHGVSEDHSESFHANHNVKCCEAKGMNSSAVTAWEGRRSL
jgi:hypothetical protein